MLDEYASRFHVLLKYAYRHDATDILEEIQIMSLPNYKNERDAHKVIERYQLQASGEKKKEQDTSKSQLRGFKGKLRG